MRVVHVNLSSNGGGAAIAAYRHAEAMKLCGINSCLLVLDGTEDSIVHRYTPSISSIMFRYYYRVRSSLNYYLAKPKLVWNSGYSGYNLMDNREIRDADVIYLHNICGLLNYEGLKRLLLTNKLIVLFQHDMEPFTGGCHYSFDCRKYEGKCLFCEQLNGMKSLSFKNQKYKGNKIKGFKNLLIASPSQWLSNASQSSMIHKTFSNIVVRNVIDTTLYKPIDKNFAREELGLDPDKRYLLFMACDVNSPYKGWKYLEGLLKELNVPNVEGLVIGNITEPIVNLNIIIHKLGFISSDERKVLVYSAADILVIPSVAENFPNVVIESMACGTPVVGFRTGGISEQIQHKETGFLADTISTESLLEGVNWILNMSGEDMKMISSKARGYVKENCSYQNVLKIHQKVFDYAQNNNYYNRI